MDTIGEPNQRYDAAACSRDQRDMFAVLRFEQYMQLWQCSDRSYKSR